MRALSPFLRDAWALTRPYWSSEDRWRARLLLATVIVLNLSLVGMTVVLTYWQRAFYNALEAKDSEAFTALLFTWHRSEEGGFLPSFTLVAALYILIAVYALYLRQGLEIRWRRWLTEVYLTQWLGGRAYYRMSLTDPETDNPDQRIAEDARMFVAQTLGLALGLMRSVVTLALPDGRRLLEGGQASVAPGDSVVITGASGSGKSTLFRAIAGIWPFGAGQISLPASGRALFLPQRPYIPLGTLKRAVCYPEDEAGFTDAQVAEALEAAELGHIVPRLHDAEAWDKRLSGGEQQRLALARALLLKPEWLFLDEATASLDPGAEERLYATLKARLPGTALISIAHRPAVATFHDRGLKVEGARLVET